MSLNIMMVNGRPNSYVLKEYICDTVDDIAKLPKYGIRGTVKKSSNRQINEPCAIGSTALVCDDGNGSASVYILTPSNEWKAL